jgi:hypothetical protein
VAAARESGLAWVGLRLAAQAGPHPGQGRARVGCFEVCRWQQQAQHGREAGIAAGPPSASLGRHGFKPESLSQLVKSHWVEGEFEG